MLRYYFHTLFKVPYKLHTPIDTGNGPTIVFLHGLASSSVMWMPLLPRLAITHRCIAIDLLGFGGSPKPELNYTVDDHVASVDKTIKSLKIKGPVILIGHSMGAVVAARYATIRPKSISRLLLLSCPIPDTSPAGYSLSSLNSRMHKLLYNGLANNREATLSLMRRVQKLIPVWFDLSELNWHSFRASMLNTVLVDTATEDIKKVTMPIDMFYGALDQLISTSRLKRIGAKNPNIHLHRIAAADHTIGPAYRARIVKVLNGK